MEDDKKLLGKIKDLLGGGFNGEGWGRTAKFVYNFLIKPARDVVAPFSKVQTAAYDIAKAMGMSAHGIQKTAERIIDINQGLSLSKLYTISSAELLNLQASIMQKTGRNIAIDAMDATGALNEDSTYANLAAARKFFGEGTVTDLVEGYDKIGKSMKSAAKVTGKLMTEAGEYGINLQKYTENFVSNLQMAQSYNFRSGVDGLREMARKATEVRQDMRQVASFADKVSTVGGAIETAANLQVLGGSFAAMADPLAILNESLTDINALQDRMLNMTANAAHYDSERKQVVLDPFTRQQLKYAATQMGQDPNSLIDTAMAQGRKKEFERRMEGMGISDDFKKIIANAGQIDEETGQAGVTIGNKFISLEEIGSNPQKAEEYYDELIRETRPGTEDIKEIAKSTRTIEQLLEGIAQQLDNEAAFNNITKGLFGATAVDQAYDILHGVTRESIEAIGRTDMAVSENFKQVQLAFTNLGIKATELLNSYGTPEFGKKFDEQWAAMAGTGETAQEFGKMFRTLFTELSDFSEDVVNFTKDHTGLDLDPRGPGRDTSHLGPSRNEGGGRTTQPVKNTDRYPQGFLSEAKELNIASTAQANLKADVVNIEGLAPEKVNVIRETPETMTTYQVQPTNTQTSQTTAQNNAQNPINGEIKLNISGNLMMNVMGADGKVETTNIIEILNNNKQVQTALAQMITEALKQKGYTITIN